MRSHDWPPFDRPLRVDSRHSRRSATGQKRTLRYTKTTMSKALILICLSLSFAVGLGVTSAAFAGTTLVCSAEMAAGSDAFISQTKVNWEALSQQWSTNKACDDGYFAAGYSNMVVRLFAYEWNQFHTFVHIAQTHPEFHNWVIKHIDESTSPDDLTKVLINARSCRTDEQSAVFCNDVARASEQALQRMS
jgi:hypothetical protein